MLFNDIMGELGMGLDDRDYTNRNYKVDITKRNNNLEVNTKESTQHIIHRSSSFCEYCEKEIEIKHVKETQTRSKIENGLVIDEAVEVFVEKRESLICSTCGGTFCLDCIEYDYKNKDTFVKTNICKKCKQENCSHNYLKKFVSYDKYFDYYVLECIYCGHKKGIGDPIEKIKSEDKPKTAQKNTTKTKSQKKGSSNIIDSVKRMLNMK